MNKRLIYNKYNNKCTPFQLDNRYDVNLLLNLIQCRRYLYRSDKMRASHLIKSRRRYLLSPIECENFPERSENRLVAALKVCTTITDLSLFPDFLCDTLVSKMESLHLYKYINIYFWNGTLR